jgi:hypothetical protein
MTVSAALNLQGREEIRRRTKRRRKSTEKEKAKSNEPSVDLLREPFEVREHDETDKT